VAYLTRALRLQAGVVISASHNPFDDNGIKFFSGDGTKLPDAVEERIESGSTSRWAACVSSSSGKARRIDDAAGRYIEFCKSTFPNALDLRGLKIVVDCAHGAAYHIAPHVFHELGADVIGHRRQAQWPEHQRGGRRDASRGAGRRGARAPAPMSASRSTATPTA
jgi:phosphoglucosamine mutase